MKACSPDQKDSIPFLCDLQHKRINNLVERNKTVGIGVAQKIRSFDRRTIGAENSRAGRSKSRIESDVYTGHHRI
jgi:hypothetical protein